jgi:hypothetical protein
MDSKKLIRSRPPGIYLDTIESEQQLQEDLGIVGDVCTSNVNIFEARLERFSDDGSSES